jgi:cell division protease FtsH
MNTGGDYSESIAELIDQEVKDIIAKQYVKAQEILKEKRGLLDKAAKVLLEKEKIEGQELKAMMEEATKEKE